MKQVLVGMRPKDGDSLDRNGGKQASGGGEWLSKARASVLVSTWSCPSHLPGRSSLPFTATSCFCVRPDKLIT